MKMRRCLLIFLLWLNTWMIQHVNAIAVMSVDLGSEWMKIAIVSPGVPMEIVLNKESKRKTPVAIAFRDGERSFGEDAQGVGVRFPQLSYAYLLDLVGKRMDHPSVRLHRQRFPYYDLEEDPDRGTVLFRHDNETLFSPEQLLAMLLAKAREFAVESARQAVNEVVLVVPGFLNQAERRSVLQVAELAGLKVLQLMNDYTAVALNYGIFRRKDFNETAQYIMFYDMGASTTTATVVSYQVVKTKEKGFVESNPQVSILGVGYDRSLGGLEMQLRLRDFLGRKFNELKKTSNDVFKSPRALAKLFKEAGRVKNVLSANAEHTAQVENLLDDQDFRLLVSREDFESLCSDLFERVAPPIEQALRTSGLTMDVISQVILVGAGTRVPKVQEELTAAVGMELSKNLNTDEAAAMGAVYKAADLSTGFKVKKFLTKDAVVFPIQVVFEREVEGQAAPKQVKRILFGPMNPYPQKKVLTFNKHTEDFEFSVNYADLDHLPQAEIQALGPLNLSRVALAGVGTALGKYAGVAGVESKGIKAHFTMDESGLLSLAAVELVLEKMLTEAEMRLQDAAPEESPLSKLGSTISKLFTGSDDSKAEAKEERSASDDDKKEEVEKSDETVKKSDEKVKKDEDKKVDEKGEKKEDASENVTATKPTDKKPKVVVIKEPIAAVERPLRVAEMNSDQLQDIQQRLDALNEFDRQRVHRASALNALEAFVFDAQLKLDSEEYQAAATEEEANKIRNACSEASDWLYEDGLDADVKTYESKLSHLKSLTEALFRRVREHQERPSALEALSKALNSSRHFLRGAQNMSGEEEDGEPIFTSVELSVLEKAIDETDEWKTKLEAEQSALELSTPPKLTVKSIGEKISVLDREVKYLISKIKMRRPSKPKEDKAKTKTNNTDEFVGSDEEEAASTKESEVVSDEDEHVSKRAPGSAEAEAEEAVMAEERKLPAEEEEERHSEL